MDRIKDAFRTATTAIRDYWKPPIMPPGPRRDDRICEIYGVQRRGDSRTPSPPTPLPRAPKPR